jgi:hypothetical protein
MSIQNIQDYVEDLNDVRDILDMPRLSLMRAEDRQRIADRISSDLSPETITCDGERDPDEIAARYRYMSRVAQELLSIDPTLSIEE